MYLYSAEAIQYFKISTWSHRYVQMELQKKRVLISKKIADLAYEKRSSRSRKELCTYNTSHTHIYFFFIA